MTKQSLIGGVVHEVPADLAKALRADTGALAAWQSLTPLLRNEWICWTITVKQQKTRDDHVRRVVEELNDGVRQPCCWVGCIHRTDKAISPSVQWAIGRRSKTTK